jgi:peroxiredoxin/tetratricopeptide (TPR) repeat protein
MNSFVGIALLLGCALLPRPLGPGIPLQPATPPDPAALALEMVDRDRVSEAVELLRQSIATDPTNVRAHAAYIRVMTFYRAAYDDVRAHYDALLAREPTNPVYPMALALGAPNGVTNRTLSGWYRQVANLAKDSFWGHYAKGQLLASTDPSGAEGELRAAISLEPASPEPYDSLIAIKEGAKNLDGAIEVATAMSFQAALSDRAQPLLWRLAFEKAGKSDQARKALQRTLKTASASNNVRVLEAISRTYAQVLDDNDARAAIDNRILELDPTWYPSRGRVTFFGTSGLNGVPRNDVTAGKTYALFGQVKQAETTADPSERLTKLRALLASTRDSVMVRFIREQMFEAAEASGDTNVVVEDGEALRVLDPEDTAIPARMALALSATPSRWREALHFADAALALTTEQRSITRPRNTDAELFAQRCNAEMQLRILTSQRALALEARGRVLCLLDDCPAGEPLLREAVSLDRTEQNLSAHVEALRKLGRTQEADAESNEAAAVFATGIRKHLINEPATDFRLETLDGRTVTLGSMRGKVVIIAFWASWCGPCKEEMPKISDLYRQNASRGIEVLGITPEEPIDRAKIETFVKKYAVTFPVLYANGVDRQYGVEGLPAIAVIGKDGNIHYRATGYEGEKSLRALELVINDLVKLQ